MLNSSTNPWESVFQHAVEFYTRGQLAEAASLFVAILEHNPDHFPSLHRLAAIRRHQGRLDESVKLLKRAVESNPDSADIHNSLGNTLNALGRQDEAVAEYRRAVTLRNSFPEAHLNLGNSLKAMRHDAEAVDAYQNAIALRPEYVDAHTNLGVVLERLNRPQEALASFSAALHFDSTVRLGNSNVGKALSALNRHEEALPFFQRAREAEPDALEPVFNEGIVRLAMGDFERGLPLYEARLKLPELKMAREFIQPLWNGETDISGKTILLHAEQGLGDTILFARYVAAVVKTGARVVLEVQKPLVHLMTSVPGVAQVVTVGDEIPEFDVHTSFCSLPLAFRTTAETIPARNGGYLKALEMQATPGPQVGVCWSGNPSYAADYKRSVPSQSFASLLTVPEVQFVSLQPNLRLGDDAILAGLENIDLVSATRWQSLADTAAVVSKLALVITVDTAVAHLAGALGRPVWVLLPFSAYWVWGRNRTDSDWYSSARLFRQTAPGDWAGVVQRVYAEIRQLQLN